MPNSTAISNQQLVEFAKDFLDGQVGRFKKDMDICLTANDLGKHAYFPALMTCLSFSELLSGLCAGKLDGQGIAEFKAYYAQFVRPKYDDLALTILYEGFRHKVAHLGHPYAVFDTSTKPKKFQGQPKRVVAWTVCAGRGRPSIRLEKSPLHSILKKTKTPWPVPYDHRIHIWLRSLSGDIVASTRGKDGYLNHLKHDANSQQNFRKCMKSFFPN